MRQSDFEEFHESWLTAHSVSNSNKVPSLADVSMVFELLSKYSIEAVQGALLVHARRTSYKPTPADICSIIDGCNTSGHLSADEAWSIAVQSFDEQSTVVMTQEIADARSVACPIWEAGDNIGARMAFREAYSRAMTNAGRPSWFVSEGFDKQIRADAVKIAVEQGRLTRQQAEKYLPRLDDGGPIGKLLTGNVVEFPTGDEALKKRWHGLKQVLLDSVARDEEKRLMEKLAKQAEFDERKRKASELAGNKLRNE